VIGIISAIKDLKFNFIDVLLLLTIVLQDAGTFGVLPLNAFQMLVLLMAVLLVVKFIKRADKSLVPYKVFILLFYMGIITVIHYFDFEAVKSFGYFSIQFVTLALYFLLEDNKEKILAVIYFAAAILAIYGFIQEFGYIIKVPQLYDPTLYGFYRFYATEIGGGLIAMYSLYAEPAHLAAIFCAGIMIGLYRKDAESKALAFTNPVVTVIIAVAGVLAYSATMYLGLVITLIYILLSPKIEKKKKIIILVCSLAAVVIAGLVFKNLVQKIIVSRFLGLITEFYIIGNGTTFAICSNLRVAIAKMMEGKVFGTGFDSNRYYYYDYVDRIYGVSGTYLNAEDAASVFTRIFSEFGIVGLAATVIYLLQKLVKSIKESDSLLLMMTLLFVIQGVRDGSYANIMLMLPFIFMFDPKGRLWTKQ
jgi:hypothetical protein